MARGTITGWALTAAVVAAFLMPATALADQPPSPNEPGIAQYTETLPTSDGGQAVGSSSKSHKLSPKIQAKLKREGGREANALTAISSSGAYGAPQTKLRTAATAAKPKPKPVHLNPGRTEAAAPASPSAGSAAASSAGHGFVLVLVLVLVLLTGATVAITVWRRRRPS